MKKFVIAAVVASLLGMPTLATAQSREHSRTVTTVRQGPHGNTRVVQKTTYRDNWRKGQRFDRRYARNYQEISTPNRYRLRAAPRGYHWVRSGNDAVLVGVTSGIIASVIANSFR